MSAGDPRDIYGHTTNLGSTWKFSQCPQCAVFYSDIAVHRCDLPLFQGPAPVTAPVTVPVPAPVPDRVRLVAQMAATLAASDVHAAMDLDGNGIYADICARAALTLLAAAERACAAPETTP